jgi:hypothetical protein
MATNTTRQKDAYYFPHDSNARHDPKILMMRSHHGAKGYGWWWIILEMLREQAGYKLPLKCVRNAMAMQMQCAPDEAEKFVDQCIHEYELLHIDGENVFAPSLIRKMDPYDNRRKQNAKNARKRWKSRGKSDAQGAYANTMQSHSERSAMALQRQCKERRGEERKGEDTEIPIRRADGAAESTDNRKKFGKWVELSNAEHSDLVGRFGADQVDYYIGKVNAWLDKNPTKVGAKPDAKRIPDWIGRDKARGMGYFTPARGHDTLPTNGTQPATGYGYPTAYEKTQLETERQMANAFRKRGIPLPVNATSPAVALLDMAEAKATIDTGLSNLKKGIS